MNTLFLLTAVLVVGFCNATSPPAKGKCPCGWVTLHNRCYKFFAISVKWTVARKHCQTMGGDLVIVSDPTETSLLLNAADHYGVRDPWIGLFRPLYNPETFITVCGVEPTYTNWGKHEPNNHGGDESCVHLYSAGQGRGKWNDLNCNRYHNYICEFNYIRCD